MEFTSKITVTPVQKMGGDYMVAAAARVSTSGEDALTLADPSRKDEIKGLINYLVKHRHGSCFEHGSMTFFVHAPIFVFREWHRHRVMSYNEESARYTQLNPVFWIPNKERKLLPVDGFKPARPMFQAANDKDYDWLIEDMKQQYTNAYDHYQSRIDRGYAKEVARAALPVGTYSSCWVTCNPRSLMAFLSLRTYDPKATFTSYPQAEIEEAARVTEEFLKEGWPLVYEAFCANGRVAP